MRFLRLFAFVVAIASWTIPSHAQVTTGTISGLVTDTSGAVMPGAKVLIQNEDTSITRTATTDSAGRYSAPSLSLGNYRITISMEGFQTEVRSGIVLTIAREAVVNVQLSVGSMSQSVEVTGEAPLVQTTEATVSYVVTDRTMRDLPLNGRDMSQLILLNPGVSQAMNANTTTAYSGFGKKISIGGFRDEDNSYLLDGSYIGDFNHNIPAGPSGALLGLSTVREFQVLTNSFGAQYGRTLGGVFNAVSKSGTNEWHGDAYEFLRNSAVDARNFFDLKSFPNDPRLPAYRRNQFGATIGGPIRKDKTFFFVAYEGMRERLGSTQFATVPDLNARHGIIPGQAPIQVSSKVIPYLALFPLPSPNGQTFNNGTAQYVFQTSRPTQDDFGQARVDHQFSDKDSLFGRFTGSKSFQSVTLGYPGLQQLRSLGTRLFTVSETHVISPTLLNVARISFNRILPADDGVYPKVDPSLISVPGQPVPELDPGSGITNFAGYQKPGEIYTTNRYNFQDDVNLTLGGHALQLGGLIERLQLNMNLPDRPFGVWTFASLPAFLQATPQRYRGTPPNLGSSRRGFRQTFFALYFQDDWRVTSRLTLNLGVRWEPYTVPTEANGLIANMRNLTDGHDTYGEPYWQNKSWGNIGPRFGFAWSPSASGNTSVRGGFAITYMPNDTSIYRTQADRTSLFPSLDVPVTVSFFPDALAQIAALRQTSPGANQSINYSNLKSPHALQFNLNVQQQFGKSNVLSVGYTGSRGINLTAVTIPSAPPATFDGVSLAVAPNAQVLYGPYTSITLYSTDANSWYNGMNATFQHRFSAGLQVQLAYTFSRALSQSDASQVVDYSGSGTGTLRYAHDLSVSKGLSGFNVGQRLSANYSYDIPLGKGLTGVEGHLLSGWQWTGILTLQDGQPFNITGGITSNFLNNLGYTQSPNAVAGYRNIVLGGPNKYFDPLAFYAPTPLELGNVGRNVLIGPGLAQWDTGLTKNTNVTERLTLQFRGEFFNVLNRANFAKPAASIFAGNGTRVGNAGVITSTVGSSRQVQFSLRLMF